MSKTAAIIFTCSKCDAQHPKWLGQCSVCGGWGTLTQTIAARREITLPSVSAANVPTLDTIDGTAVARLATGITEFDVAVGGGLVAGSALLLAGEPGIGKSTLVLQVAAALANRGEVLYVSGEETAAQIKSRAERLGVVSMRHIRFSATNDGQTAVAAIRTIRPVAAIIDSVQTLSLIDLPPEAGGVTQIRALTNLLVNTAKETGVPTVIIGHVTKDGSIAGPKMLEHLVDQVAVLEGDPATDLRVLRTTKNRYGPTDVVGVFVVKERGLEPCADPSAAFLSQQRIAAPGNAVAIVTHGNRTLLVEIQALVTRSSFGQPQRRTLGVDINRLYVLLAILAKYGGISLASHDVHVATVGGFRLDDPGADLAILAALASAAANTAVPFDACVGEIGLNGLIRPNRQMERGIREAIRLGRSRLAAPPETSREKIECFDGVETFVRALTAQKK